MPSIFDELSTATSAYGSKKGQLYETCALYAYPSTLADDPMQRSLNAVEQIRLRLFDHACRAVDPNYAHDQNPSIRDDEGTLAIRPMMLFDKKFKQFPVHQIQCALQETKKDLQANMTLLPDGSVSFAAYSESGLPIHDIVRSILGPENPKLRAREAEGGPKLRVYNKLPAGSFTLQDGPTVEGVITPEITSMMDYQYRYRGHEALKPAMDGMLIDHYEINAENAKKVAAQLGITYGRSVT